MKRNMGSGDKFLRVSFAVLIGLLFSSGVITGTLGVILLIVAGILALTSLVGFCPLYALLGFSTRNPKKPKPQA